MSTESETGWSKTLPEQQGWYWVRNGSLGLPVVVEFFPAFMDSRLPKLRYPGKKGFMLAIADDANPEWLGPLTPADAEQLVRLREAATKAITLIATGQRSSAMSLLRNALSTQREEANNVE